MRRLIDQLEDLWTLSLSPDELDRARPLEDAGRREQLARIERLESALSAFDQMLGEHRRRAETFRPSTLAGRFDLIRTFQHEVGLT